MSTPNDLIRFAMERAVEGFGGKRDGMFNGAKFAHAMRSLSGVNQILDGRMVTALLVGRSDVERLHGGSHYRLLVV